MSRNDWINYLGSMDARFAYCDNDGKLDQIYVFRKDSFDEKKAHPRKNKDLYVPYIRLSDFDETECYTRWNGWTGIMSNDDVKELIMSNDI